MRVFDDVFTLESAYAALDMLFKLGFGSMLAGAIGWERELHGRPAGIRTHMLVVIGVILFCEVSANVGGDPGRIAAQVVTGIGFLGAGTILRLGAEIKGLTTAASIWAVAGIGMAVSMSGPFLIVASAATLLTLFTLAVVDSIERRISPHAHKKACNIELETAEILGDVVSAVTRAGGHLEGVRVLPSDSGLSAVITLTGPREKLLERIAKLKGVRSAEWAG
jgi:putative Mg2+ transporter-C (MgtC) family protein